MSHSAKWSYVAHDFGWAVMFKWTDFSIVKLFVIKTFPFLKPVKKRKEMQMILNQMILHFQMLHNMQACVKWNLSFYSLSAPTSVNPLMTVRWRARWTMSSIRDVLLPRERPSPAAGPMMLMQVQSLYPEALWLFTRSTCKTYTFLYIWCCANESLRSQRRHRNDVDVNED